MEDAAPLPVRRSRGRQRPGHQAWSGADIERSARLGSRASSEGFMAGPGQRPGVGDGPQQSRRSTAADRGIGAAYAKAGPYIDASWQLVGSVVLLTALGWWLDGKFGTRPWLLVAGAMLGLATGFYSFFRAIMRLAANQPRQHFEIRPPDEFPDGRWHDEGEYDSKRREGEPRAPDGKGDGPPR